MANNNDLRSKTGIKVLLAVFIVNGIVFAGEGIPFTILRDRSSLIPDSVVVLTFDDGPNNNAQTTEKLLEVLRRHRVHAHFCLMGKNAEKYPDLVLNIHREGHDIVCHSFSDKPILFRSKSYIKKDIARFFSSMKKILGDSAASKISYYRPPYGIYGFGFKSVLAGCSLHLMPVTFYTWDAGCGPGDKNKIIKKTLKGIRKNTGGILVLHDGRNASDELEKKAAADPDCGYNREWVPDAVDSIITQLEKDGFHFRLLQECRPDNE